jgi:hypothetical protein
MKIPTATSGKSLKAAQPRATYPPGTYPLQKYNLSKGQTSASASATRQNWPDIGEDVLSLILNISFDSGNTWQLLLGFTAAGGNLIDMDGKAVTTSTASTILPQPDNPNRQLSGTVTIFATLTSTVTVTVN